MENLNPILREHLVSGLHTFITVFVTVLGTTLSAGDLQWTGAFWSSVLLVAVRAGVKEVFARLATPSLGGRKKV